MYENNGKPAQNAIEKEIYKLCHKNRYYTVWVNNADSRECGQLCTLIGIVASWIDD